MNKDQIDESYDGYKYQFLYITDYSHNMSEVELRNTFARFNIKCQILQDKSNMSYALVTLQSYADTKEFIRASLNTPYYVTFQDDEIRYGLKINYKYMLYKKKPNINFINKSQYQARAALNDPYFISNYLK